jgi:hypothetical protein
VFDRLGEPQPQERLAEVAGRRVATVFEAGRLAEARHTVARGHVERLRADLPAAVPVHEVPELFAKAGGRRVVAMVADALLAAAPEAL